MTEQKFKSEMRRAQTMARIDENPLRQEYWAGYQRGLRRAFHGPKFGTKEEHLQWLDLLDDRDEARRQRGQGYRDGLAFDGIASRMGRPPHFSEPMNEVISLRLPADIVKKIPSPAGEWIRNLLMNTVKAESP